MKTGRVLPVLLFTALILYGQTSAKSTPTPLEAFVLSQPSLAVHRQLVGRIIDGNNSVAVNVVIARSKDKEMRGFEFVVATTSKHDSIYWDQDHVNGLTKQFADGTMKMHRSVLIDECKQRGSSYGWDAFFSSMVEDPPNMHTLNVGWLFTGSEDLGTMIQIPNPSSFLCPLPNTPVPKIFELISQGLSQLNPEF